MYNIYFAGDLFDHKHLTGNLVLAERIKKLSHSRYICSLPQEWAIVTQGALQIRNQDLKAVINADAVIFNFDGVDLDSGTVVEYMIAKMLDIPAVLLRTDCRNGGYHGDDWNSMVAGFPRSIEIKHPALIMAKEMGLDATHELIAESVVKGLDWVMKEPSLFASANAMRQAYHHVISMCGSGLDLLVTPEHINERVARMIAS